MTLIFNENYSTYHENFAFNLPVHFRYFAISLTWQASMLECCITVLPVPNCLDEHLSCNWWMKFCADNESAAAPAAAVEEQRDKKSRQQCCAKGTRLLKYVVFVKSVHVDHIVKTYLLLVKKCF